MSLFEMATGSRYNKVVFDDDELNVIRTACAYVSAKEIDLMGDASDAGLEQFAFQAKRVYESDMAHELVSLFKAGQEVLIEPEDLDLVLESLKNYLPDAPGEHVTVLERAIEKIEQCCGPD
jgi:hypothetical protein